jgi:hypothetical protein
MRFHKGSRFLSCSKLLAVPPDAFLAIEVERWFPQGWNHRFSTDFHRFSIGFPGYSVYAYMELSQILNPQILPWV